MPMYDCHMHSDFSFDSSMDITIACEKSISLGLDGIAFTDHIDIDTPDLGTCNFNIQSYINKISYVQDRYAGKLKVLKAVEIGIQPHVIDESLAIVKNNPFDYVLASVHLIDRLDPYKREYYKGKTKKEVYERYLQEIYFMVRNFPSFDMVGHFEFIIRCAGYPDRTLRYADHSEILDCIMKELILQGRGFELNTGTFRDNPSDAEYDIEILKRYRQLGGELICLGSDAHCQEHIAARFDFYAQMIREAGFKYTVHFENRKPVFDKI